MSLPCLQGILETKKFQSYLLFVDSIFSLLKDSITQEEINACEYKLVKSVGECELLYGVSFITYNVHSLLHYYESARRTGPLWSNSAFLFENAIFKFIRQINASNGCLKQIAEKWLRKLMFESYIENNSSNAKSSVEYCRVIFENRAPLQKSTKLNHITFLGTGKFNKNVQDLIRAAISIIGKLKSLCMIDVFTNHVLFTLINIHALQKLKIQSYSCFLVKLCKYTIL